MRHETRRKLIMNRWEHFWLSKWFLRTSDRFLPLIDDVPWILSFFSYFLLSLFSSFFSSVPLLLVSYAEEMEEKDWKVWEEDNEMLLKVIVKSYLKIVQTSTRILFLRSLRGSEEKATDETGYICCSSSIYQSFSLYFFSLLFSFFFSLTLYFLFLPRWKTLSLSFFFSFFLTILSLSCWMVRYLFACKKFYCITITLWEPKEISTLCFIFVSNTSGRKMVQTFYD